MWELTRRKIKRFTRLILSAESVLFAAMLGVGQSVTQSHFLLMGGLCGDRGIASSAPVIWMTPLRQEHFEEIPRRRYSALEEETQRTAAPDAGARRTVPIKIKTAIEGLAL
jgi:hypothetical protein